MVKVLIVDSNDDRRTLLTASLRQQGKIVSSMCMISLVNIQNIVSSHDVLIVLDQEDMTVRAVFNCIASTSIKLVFNNDHVMDEIDFGANIILLHQDETLENTLNKIGLLVDNNLSMQIIAEDSYSKAMLDIARKAAKTHATILITGETGTGKEVLAHYLHHHSNVSRGPFVSVNCAALPENMMEAILFGYEKGSFTSAIQNHVGKFEQAHNGTLLLDEVSEISLGLQAKLLRALQEREIERLGGKKTIKVNVRIIAATNRDLHHEVMTGTFRKDLFYRLNVFPIHCLTLRDRPLDILPLAEYLIRHHAELLGCKVRALSDAAKLKLVNYDWPGNIREMENIVQRALIMVESDLIEADDLDIHLEKSNLTHLNMVDQFTSKLEESEAKVILDVLMETNGCKNIAATKLNISPRTLRYKLAKLRAIGVKVP